MKDLSTLTRQVTPVFIGFSISATSSLYLAVTVTTLSIILTKTLSIECDLGTVEETGVEVVLSIYTTNRLEIEVTVTWKLTVSVCFVFSIKAFRNTVVGISDTIGSTDWHKGVITSTCLCCV